MDKKNGPWTIKNTENKYRDDFIELKVDSVIQPDGKPGTYSVIDMKNGVSVLPIDNDNNVYLAKQFRYALGKESIEVITGGIDNNEKPIDCAKREAQEEAGIEANEWIDLGYIDLDTSIVKCPINLFIAKELSFTEDNQDNTENIKSMKISFEKAVEMVMNNQITHAPSCIMLLKAYQYLKAKK